MTPSTLRAVTLKTVANYAQAAERAVVAYRVGGQRLIAAVQRGVDLAAQSGPERLAGALRRAGGNVSDLAGKGLDVVSTRTERAIEIGTTGVTSQLSRVADLADGVSNDLVANGLQAAARISLPGAQVALALSERVVATAGKLPGTPVVQAAAKVRSTVARVRPAAKPQAATVAKTTTARVAKASAKAKAVVAETVAAVVAEAAPKAASKVSSPASRPATAKPAPRKAPVAAAPAPVKASAPRVRRPAATPAPVVPAAPAEQAATAAASTGPR